MLGVMLFTESALWANSAFMSPCPDVVCLFVRAIAENPFPGGLEISGRRAYRLYGHTSRHFPVFVVSMNFWALIWFWVFLSLQTSLLCIMGELAGGGTVAVAVIVSDK